MSAFFDKYSPIFQLSFQNFSFDTDYEKHAIVEISTKKKIICDTELINMWISADEAYLFTVFPMLRHHEVITIYIGYMIQI